MCKNTTTSDTNVRYNTDHGAEIAADFRLYIRNK